MDSGGSKSESQDSNELVPPGTLKFNISNIKLPRGESSNSPTPSPSTTTSKGVMNAKKRLRAFSIQKKTPLTPIPVAKGTGAGSAMVYIGKLASVKATPKQEDSNVEYKRPPKPPKPGVQKKLLAESYTELQRKTLSEIEDMKRKMELVELGIPLGLICPSSFNDKAMPTKAMPPIKSFLDPEKVDEIIREAKQAKADGKEFKFDYHKLLPDYDNPFQRKKEDSESHKTEQEVIKDKDKQKGPKIDWKYNTYRRIDKNKYREERGKHDKRKYVRKDKLEKDKKLGRESKEANVNLNDYLVCDSWSLDNDDKNSTSSPKIDEKLIKNIPLPDDFPRISVEKDTPKKMKKEEEIDSPLGIPSKIEKLRPVKDSFTYEIDPNDDDEILNIFDGDCSLDKFSKLTMKKEVYDSPVDEVIELDQSLSKDTSLDGTIDDTFLESVINEIKQEDMSDDGDDDKALVEYDLSPKDDKEEEARESVTPELKDYHSSQRSDYSDGYRSIESGYKSTESGYKSSKSYQSDTDYKSSDSRPKSTEREYKSKKRHKSLKNESDYKSSDEFKSSKSGYKSKESGYKSPEIDYKSAERDYKASGSGYKTNESDYKASGSGYKSNESDYKAKVSVDSRRLSFLSSGKEFEEETKMSKTTVDSLETWSFVMKICQPLLFRHDRNKCYKETEVLPKVWYTENPKICNCVKDRSVVYEELEMCKMSLVDRVYGCDQIQDPPASKTKCWYPRAHQCITEASVVGPPPSDDWEVEEINTVGGHRGPSMTPQRNEEIYLDTEYQRFMQAVLTDVSETKQETSRSTTPVTQDIRKKKKTEDEEDKKKVKKIKLSSEGWSQESDIEEETQKNSKKIKSEREKKRKHSVSSLSENEIDVKKKRKTTNKKNSKKSKSKLEKRRRLNKKYLKKLKVKEKKNKRIKLEKFDGDSEDDMDRGSKKRKYKKRKLQKLKKKNQKKKKSKPKSSSSSESSSSSTDSSDSEEEKRRKKKKDKRKRKKSTSESTQSEELFDVNILNNIKKERLTDDEKLNEFSPRKKPREIINVKELQNDFVGNNIDIKKEVEDKKIVQESIVEKKEILQSPELTESVNSTPVEKYDDFKEPQDSNRATPQIQPPPEESNLSQCSSQDSVMSKDCPIYEKDESHLRPSSQNSNYSFNDVISASHQMEDVRSASRQMTDVRSDSRQIGDVTDSQMSDSISDRHQMNEVLSARRQIIDSRSVSRQMTDITDSHMSDTISDRHHMSEVLSVRRQMIDSRSESREMIDSRSESRQMTDVTDSQMSDTISDRNQMNDVLSARHQIIDARSISRQMTDVTDSPISDTISDRNQISEDLSVRRQMIDSRSESRQMTDVSDSQMSDTISDRHRMSEVLSTRRQINDARSANRQMTDMTDSQMSDTTSDRHQISNVLSARRQMIDVTDSQMSEPTADSHRMSAATSARSQMSDFVRNINQMTDNISDRRQNDVISADLRAAEVTIAGHLRHEMSDVTSVRHAIKDVTSVRHTKSDVTSVRHAITDVIPDQYQKEEEKFNESYEHESYEMYEQMAMAYQSDVASQVSSPPGACSQRIETVVRTRGRGEIKCDWRAGDDTVLKHPHRPSRWGLKPGEVNIVLTGHGNDQFSNTTPEQDNRVYQIQSIANRTDTSSNTGYDEAYMSMYGALDRLQYGDCFATNETREEQPSVETSEAKVEQHSTSSLDARISHALQNTVLGEVVTDDEEETDKDGPEKGILVTKSLAINESIRGAKRVSFADGYKPGQDSDLEEPPKKKKRSRRLGCAWPCPASHPDHVPLWDALPPPPPPAGSPPPTPTRLHLVARHIHQTMMQPPPRPMAHKFEASASMPSFMPPEPPPGLITF